MTFLGFIVAVLIIGGIFYAWYAFASRTGTNDVAQGAGRMRASTTMETGTIGELPEEKQGKYVQGNAANSGNIPRHVLNPDHGYNAEAGTIGETDEQGSSFQQNVNTIQQAQPRHNTVQKIGDVFQQSQQLQAQQQLQQALNKQGQPSVVAKGLSEGYTQGFQQGQKHGPIDAGMNAETQMMGNNIHTTTGMGKAAGGAAGQQDLTSAIHQAFREEFYHMDENDKTH